MLFCAKVTFFSFGEQQFKKHSYLCSRKTIGVWCSWLAFLHGVQAVARSSRATPTAKKQLKSAAFFVQFCQKKGIQHGCPSPLKMK